MKVIIQYRILADLFHWHINRLCASFVIVRTICTVKQVT